jgi:glycosyltransferase involved in cell wall biosynthesis
MLKAGFTNMLVIDERPHIEASLTGFAADLQHMEQKVSGNWKEGVVVNGKLLVQNGKTWKETLRSHFNRSVEKRLGIYRRKRLGFASVEFSNLDLMELLKDEEETSADQATEDDSASMFTPDALLESFRQHLRIIKPTAINLADKVVTLTDGSAVSYSRLVFAMPIHHLKELLPPKSDLSWCAKSLAKLDSIISHTVCVELEGEVPLSLCGINQVHFVDPDPMFYSVNVKRDFKNPGHWSLVFNISESNKMPVDPTTLVNEVLMFAESHSLFDPEYCSVVQASHSRAAPAVMVRTQRHKKEVEEAMKAFSQNDVYFCGELACANDMDPIEWAQHEADQLAALFAPSRGTTDDSEKQVCVVFMHSLQRNGANNCALFTVTAMLNSYKFLIISPSDGPMQSDFDELGVELIVRDPKHPSYNEEVGNILSAPSIGLVLANTIMMADVVVLAESKDVPTAWVIHEAWPPEKFEYYAKEVFMMSHIDSEIIRKAFSLCSRIVFPSNVQRDIYEELLQPGCAETIYNGIPLENLDCHQGEEKRMEARQKYGYSDDEIVLLHIGTICHRKGQIYAAEAFLSLCDKIDRGDIAFTKKPRLLMVGARYIRQHEIDYINKIKTMVEASNHADKVTILDIQNNPAPFYAAADIVLVPSLNEVLPLVICEAMAMKKPVICSRIDAIPEAFEHGVEGLLVPPADALELEAAIECLYENEELRMEMGERGRERVLQQFSFESCQMRYQKMFHEMLENTTVSAN